LAPRVFPEDRSRRGVAPLARSAIGRSAKEETMAEILVAHAPAAAARAGLIVNKLEKLGFTVSREPPRARDLPAAIGRAQRVLVLWSKDAARTPALRAAMNAKQAGKLAIARLDGAAPPARLGASAVDLSRWTGRETARNWRRLVSTLPGATPRARSGFVATAPAAASAASEPGAKKREGFGWVFILGLVAVSAAAAAGAYAYFR
jgi:hypothetical protein